MRVPSSPALALMALVAAVPTTSSHAQAPPAEPAKAPAPAKPAEPRKDAPKGLPAYAGSSFGAKRILAVGAAFDAQKDYQGLTADLFADLPTSFGSVVGTALFQAWDGGATVTALPKQSTFSVEAGVFFKGVKLGPWARYERRSYSANDSKDESRVLVGLNYYVRGLQAYFF